MAPTRRDLPDLATYAAAFASAPSPYLLLAPDAPEYTILAANDSYCRSTLTVCEGPEGILGQPLFKVFPDNPEAPNPEALTTLKDSLDRVLRTRLPHTMDIQKYDIPRPQQQGFEERYWSQVNTPVFNNAGEVICILHYAADVTEATNLLKAMTLEGEVSTSLRLHNERLQAEITRRQNAEEARDKLLTSERAARNLAEEASRAKSAFLARMSHEIRTPINAIIGYTDLVEMGLSGPITPTQQQQLSRVHNASNHLLRLVNELLDLAKVEHGHLEVNCEQVQVSVVAHQATELVKSVAAGRHITLLNLCPENSPFSFQGDGDRVRQILINLLNNALKFTKPTGQVTLSCTQSSGLVINAPACNNKLAASWICLSVKDTGIGISEIHLASIFEPFVQADSSLTRPHEGAGLGLAISRELARLMGGDITVQSTPGVGSMFTLWLPEVSSGEVLSLQP